VGTGKVDAACFNIQPPLKLTLAGLAID